MEFQVGRRARCDASQFCTTDADCKGKPGTPRCDFSCVECKDDADCNSARPTCDYDQTCKSGS